MHLAWRRVSHGVSSYFPAAKNSTPLVSSLPRAAWQVARHFDAPCNGCRLTHPGSLRESIVVQLSTSMASPLQAQTRVLREPAAN